MGTPTYKPLATVRITSAVSSVTISSISQDFTDLYLTAVMGTNNDSNYLYCRFNGSTTGYKWGDWHDSGWNAVTAIRLSMLDTDSFATGTYVLPQYRMTDRYRQIWGRSAVTRKDSLAGDIMTGGWESGDPINSITLFTEGTFPAGSSFAVFGVIR